MPSTRTPDPVSRGAHANPAVRAEPQGIGTSGARDPLAREIKLLGSLLGQVIAEQAGEGLLELVELVRRLTIDIRKTTSPESQRELRAVLESLSPDQIEDLIKAFSLYFHLTNLAEEKHRVRRIRKRARTATAGGLQGSIDAAIRRLIREDSPEQAQELLGELSIGLVLTAHPTEARRRTLLVALRRCFSLLDRLDDPRLTPNEDSEIRRRLREEISLLWRTSALRLERPSPLDEVRSAMLFFDETLFRVTPRLYRTLDRALDRAPWLNAGTTAARARSGPASDSGRTGTRPPAISAYLRWGSWVGADRDGHPHVTADTTRAAAAIGADHALRGYEAVARRLMYTVATTELEGDTDAALASRLEQDRKELGGVYDELQRRFPNEPYRCRLGSIAERLRRTRHRVVDDRWGLGS
ncbi:MAG: phosphoenolpyruvate carboxylase, partial [Chloroflexota bacterium]